MGREPVHRDAPRRPATVRVLVNRLRASRRARVRAAGRHGHRVRLRLSRRGPTRRRHACAACCSLPDGYRASSRRVGRRRSRAFRASDSYRGFCSRRWPSTARRSPSSSARCGHRSTLRRARAPALASQGGGRRRSSARATRAAGELVLENHSDTVHPAFVHASSIWAARQRPVAGGARLTRRSACGRCSRTARRGRSGRTPGCWSRGLRPFVDGRLSRRQPARGGPQTIRRSPSTAPHWSGGSGATARRACSVSCAGQHRLSQLLFHEPVPPASRRPSDRGSGLHGRVRVLVQAQGRARADRSATPSRSRTSSTARRRLCSPATSKCTSALSKGSALSARTGCFSGASRAVTCRTAPGCSGAGPAPARCTSAISSRPGSST